MAGLRFRRIPRSVLSACERLGLRDSRPPQNTRYVVVSGARQKDEEWDPEENGGFAIHGTRRTPCYPRPVPVLTYGA